MIVHLASLFPDWLLNPAEMCEVRMSHQNVFLELTVVTVVRNAIRGGRARMLAQCLDSVQSQVRVDAEHLVIDGASDDGTLELLAARPVGRIPLVVSSACDAGIYDAMNRGLKLARGRFVIFLNSDDYYCNPQGLSDSVRALEETGADFAFSPTIVQTERDGRIVDSTVKLPDVQRIFVHMALSHQSMMARTAALLEHGGFDIRYSLAADYDLLLRLILSGAKACEVEEPFVVFRSGGASGQNREQVRREVGQVFSRLYAPYAETPLTAEVCRRMNGNAIPRPLQERLHAFYRRTFESCRGNACGSRRTHVPCAVLHELAWFKFNLMALKKGASPLSCLLSVVRSICRHPLWSMAFVRECCHTRAFVPGRQIARVAYERVARQVSDRATCAETAGIEVAATDYWKVLGAYCPEPWGVWAPRQFFVRLPIPAALRGKSLWADAWLGRYSPSENSCAALRVKAGNSVLAEFELASPIPARRRFRILGSLTAAEEVLLTFETDCDYCPSDYGAVDDVRSLGISFSGLSAQEDVHGNG